MKTLTPITCNPAPWDIQSAYFNKSDENKRKALCKLPTIGTPQRKTITLQNGDDITVWQHGKNGDYWKNGKSLLSTLEVLAAAGNSQIRIY